MDYKGEHFLNKLYKDLNLTEEVKHSSKGSNDKDESVHRYMDRLEKIHNLASGNEHKLNLLKKLYYDKYVVKKKDISRYRDKDRIIKEQEDSFSKWLDYLLDKNARYPMWAKYWAFQGMLKIGAYDEANGVYQKRSKKTLAPFIEINPEVLARCIELVVEYVDGIESNDKNLEKLIESGNFSKLYTMFLKKSKEVVFSNSDYNDGVWITYHHETVKEAEEKEKQGIEPEYLKLYKSLQGYNTGWCTAGSKSTAKDQICGVSSYNGGDFHVYYTKDDNGEYKVPRIAIRMEKEYIGEIRGIADGQNLEDGLEDILESKISEFDNLTEEDIDEYLKIIDNMKRLTLLKKKIEREEKFTVEDIRFIYEIDGKIDGFGWEKDSRIKKIIKKRDIIKDSEILEKREDIIKFWSNIDYFKCAPEYIKSDREIVMAVMEQSSPLNFKYASDVIKKDKEFVLKLLGNEDNISSVLFEKIGDDEVFMLELLKEKGFLFKFVSDRLKSDKEFILKVVEQSRDFDFVLVVSDISKELLKDRDFLLKILEIDLRQIVGLPEKLKEDKKFILEVAKRDYRVLLLSDELIGGKKSFLMKVRVIAYHALKSYREKKEKENSRKR